MIYIVTGPPCVGKSTWVREHAQPGDVVIDLDRLALAITAENTNHHDYPRHIREYARKLRATAVALALAHGRSGTSFIIDARPGPRNRAAYRKAQAQFVDLTAPLDVLRDRCRAERPPWVEGLLADWYVPRHAQE